MSNKKLEQYYSVITSPPMQKAQKRARNTTSLDNDDETTVMASEGSKIDEILSIVRDMKDDMRCVKEKVGALEEAISHIDLRCDEQKSVSDRLVNENQAMRNELDELKHNFAELDTKLSSEIRKRDDLETHSRRMNLEFGGIPKVDGEDCLMLVAKVMQAAGSENTEGAIDVAHRKIAGGIIARFRSRAARDEVYEKRFNLQNVTSRNLGFTLPERGNPIFINESLSFDRAKLLRNVRDKIKLLNDGAPKERKIKYKTVLGTIKVMDAARNYKSVNSMADFIKLYPGNDY